MKQAHFIFFVSDQQKSCEFYSAVFGYEPVLNVPGMTQFSLPGGTTLGLMPAAGIKRLLGDSIPDFQASDGSPRGELYLLVDEPELYLEKAGKAGAKLISEIQPRDWGDEAGYCMDLDGHLIAFAK
jgi:uncharacterized protein